MVSQLGWIATTHMEKATSGDLYISSIYWAITTLSTVGYGDFKGYTNEEYLYTMGVEFIGIGFFGFIMGSLNKIILSQDLDQDIIADRLDNIDYWLLKLDQSRKSKSLPKPLYDKIKQYIERSFVFDFHMLVKDNDFFD